MQEPTQTERALLRVARTLAAAFDVEEITAEITRTALELTGAAGAYVERVNAPGQALTVVAIAGDGTPPHGSDVPYPGSLTEALIASGKPMATDSGLVVPLFFEGDVVGALILLRGDGSAAFGDHATTSACVLGDLVSVALKRVTRETALLADAEREEKRSRFLASASVILSSSLDLTTTLQNLTNLAIEAIADWCVIDVVAEDGSINRVAGAHRDPSKRDMLKQLMSSYAPQQGSDNPAAKSLRGGDPVIMNAVTPEAMRSITRNEEHASLAMQMGFHSVMSVPLNMAGTLLGVITLIRAQPEAIFNDADLLFAQDLATRAALAISNARHYSAAEEARGQAEQDRLALERVMEGKTRLIRGFSHDIKNPLGAADGYAQLLLDGLMGELTAKQQESIGRIRTGISTALGLINDVVEFSRAESGQIEVRPSPFNADALVREVVAEHRAAAEQAQVTVHTGVVEGGDLTCDAIRIRQILGNLVTNAVKYGGSPGDVTVSVQREESEHPRMLFSVADTGQGIPVEKQHLLFEEFTRLHTGKKEGSGLGLAISRRIARVLGGDIIVDSAEGRGSTFTLWIPVARK